MARMSKGKLARQKKQNRKEHFAIEILDNPKYKNIPRNLKLEALAFRNDVVAEGERLSEVDGYEKGMSEVSHFGYNIYKRRTQ